MRTTCNNICHLVGGTENSKNKGKTGPKEPKGNERQMKGAQRGDERQMKESLRNEYI